VSGGAVLLDALFASESQMMAAIRMVSERESRIEEIYSPYPVAGGLEYTGQRRTRLPWICFALGLAGAGFKIWFQFWASTVDWPVNVGGKPWNSLPAFVPVTFEVMVLLAGLGAVALFLARLRLFSGGRSASPYARVFDDGFALRILVSRAGEELRLVEEALEACGALRIDRRTEGGAR
jgi:hypothetical protein